MLFLGRISSTLGDSIYEVAVIWHVYYLTNSTFFTGLATAFTMIPKVLNFLFGPWVEYNNKQSILKYSQYIQFFLMLIIPLSFYSGFENVWLILIVVALISFIENIQGTSEISIVPAIMGKEDIPKYNSLITSIQEIIDMSMKGIFGLVILYISIESIYLFNSLTFLVAALFFTYIRYNFEKKDPKGLDFKKYKSDLLNGIKHMATPQILFICLPFFVSNLFAGITTSILPAFSELKVNLNAYGIFLVAMSVGALIGSLWSYKLTKYSLKKVMTVFPFFGFLLFALAALVSNGIISIILFGLAHIPLGVMNVYFISYIQISISEEMLGRVSSVIDSFLVATIPIGGIVAGIFSQVLPINILMLLNSFGMLFIGLYFIFVKVEGSSSHSLL